MVKLYSDKGIYSKSNTKKQTVNLNNVGATPATPTTIKSYDYEYG